MPVTAGAFEIRGEGGLRGLEAVYIGLLILARPATAWL